MTHEKELSDNELDSVAGGAAGGQGQGGTSGDGSTPGNPGHNKDDATGTAGDSTDPNLTTW